MKEVRYLNKDFTTLRNSLLDFAKVYFPNTYRNYNESSIGLMFTEMSAYVGDVLSYYVDDSFKESLLQHAEELRSLYALAQAHGYKPLLSIPAHVDLDVFHLVPSTGEGGNIGPDWNYALQLNSNMQIGSEQNPNVVFRTIEPVDFATSSSFDPTEVTLYEVDANNVPAFYLLKKSVKAVAGEIKTFEFTFNSPEKFKKVTLPDQNIIEVLNGTDSNGNVWYNVPYLAQDTIFSEQSNVAANDPELSQYNNTVPYLLKLIKTARRFTTTIRSDGITEIQFGAGVSDSADELLIPNPTNIGSTVFGSVAFTDNSIDPANFMNTRTYGQSPANTTIEIQYVVGGGLESNVNQNDLNKVRDAVINTDFSGLDETLAIAVQDSIAANNPGSATGGRGGESPDEIRFNALANFPAQLRAVTREDYISRVYSMPPRFGGVAKAYIVQDDQLNQSNITSVSTDGNTFAAKNTAVVGRPDSISNPLALNLYTLGFDSNKKLTILNDAVKENLKVYLGQYRMLTDAINIKNGYIVNIGIKFDIITFKNFNKREVVLLCIEKMKEFFNIDKWQFNQPIVISDIYRELFSVKGLQSVANVEIINKYNTNDGYSGNIYNIEAATRDSIIYPSVDPCIFELKFGNQDIEGRAI